MLRDDVSYQGRTVQAVLRIGNLSEALFCCQQQEAALNLFYNVDEICRRVEPGSMDREFLGSFEQVVMQALLRLRENAYGVTIRREVAERAGRDVSIGAIYTTLDRLERKGFVSSWTGDPTPERGGRAKRFFRIEAAGVHALNNSREVMDRMWEGLVPGAV